MRWLDTGLMAILALWALGSVLFIVRVRGIYSWLKRWNGSLFFTEWWVFSPRDRHLRPGTFELSFQDCRPGCTPSGWRLGATGHCWAWCAFIWLPERALAIAVQNLGREIRASLLQRPPHAQRAILRARILEAYVERRQPRTPDSTRDFRLVRRFASDDSRENVLEFRGLTHASRS